MPVPAVGPRVLLRRLREVMAEPEAAQKRLDKIASLIASNMVAEVCSIYVMRPGSLLELYATEGLNPTAVHQSQLLVGEGLVGVIAAEAEPLNLSDAQTHPAFKYLPETGEEVYRSFLGVPILRAGLTLGVLVVQNQTPRQYSEEEVEALQITAMVLAEIIASGELEEVAAAVEVDVAHLRSHHLKGQILAEGVALGHAVLHEPRVVITNLIAEDIPAEVERLDRAIQQLRRAVDSMLSRLDTPRGGEHREILEAYRMFAHDRGWVNRMHEVVRTGLTAEAAVERVQSDNRARMLRQKDPYLRDRLHDLDDLANRLLRILTGQTGTAAAGELPRDAVLVARTMGPAELLDYDRRKLRGVVLEEAGETSHVAIVARALGVPLVGQTAGLLDLVDTGDPIIIDGASGEVHVRPSQDIEQAYAEKVRFYAKRQEQYARLRDRPAVTVDGERIKLSINAGLLVDLPHLEDAGADGIGLFRTELQFMIASAFPRMGEQVEHYSAVLDAANGRPVVFRSLDIGADKVLPYLRQAKEENPALGWRAIRMALDRPALMKLQLRALLKAAGGRDLWVMFPMVAEVDEFRRARELIEEERLFLERRGHRLPSSIRAGAMLEVPSLLWQLDQLLPLVDFVSIGSNDLVQFLFASDRDHPRLAGRYDPLSPTVLRAIRHVVDMGRRHDVPVNLCGEMAGRPLEAMALIGLGLRSISMTPAAIGPIKAMIMKLHAGEVAGALAPLLETAEHSIRPQLMAFAREHDVPV
ncbi:phosphoenolpyruvate--protein phosphotransferase [Kaustia mangrovi]|uniref:phosphoenolpyruvate--protein phosphotransferase n=1 Tax=Kaustia mangrovi TaxID=2593653 RepID=A0A7S8C473_9HYPH|nr:phosphoenolpyruvate--protein phosphotransferase [Kaustia mangrovi]QPC43046.1 phosphoenolpyruvate--protein phosphotransferase [Kaustia mangrovi]